MNDNCKRSCALLIVLISYANAMGDDDDEAAVAAAGGPATVTDEFEGKLALPWQTRNADQSHVSLDKRPGTLTITTQQGGLYAANTSYKNLMLVENPWEQEWDFELTTCLVSFAPFANVQQAGLVCFSDEDNYIKWVLEWHDVHGGQVFSLVHEKDGRPSVIARADTVAPGERVWLRLSTRGNNYEYATSSDGKSFRAFGEIKWDGPPLRFAGLIAKNSAGSGAPELDASFDFFHIRPPPPVEALLFADHVPDGGPDELLDYIKALKEDHPGATQAMLAAAQKILQQPPPDDNAESLRTALLLVLENRVQSLHRADLQQQREVVQYLRMLIEAIPGEQAIDLAMRAVRAMELARREEAAAEACHGFAELIAKNERNRVAKLAAQFEATARRLELPGNKLDELTGTTVDGIEFDWTKYRDRVVLVCFWPNPTRLHRAEVAAIRRYYDIYHDRGLEVLGISVDEDRGKLREFLAEEQIPWVTLHDNNANGVQAIAESFGIGAVPQAFLSDREGTVVSIHARGGRRGELLQELLGPPYRHGKSLAVAGQWKQLAADFEKVVQITPENGGAWQSLAIAYHQAGEMEAFKSTCQRAFRRLSRSNIWAQATLVQLCSFAPDVGLDREQLSQVAEVTLRGNDNTTMKLAIGMNRYRCGRFQEAIGILPKSGDSNQVPISLLFQAMAQKRLGNGKESQLLLQQGIHEMEQRIPTIDGPPLADYMPERWVVWTSHRILRREAEAVVGAPAD